MAPISRRRCCWQTKEGRDALPQQSLINGAILSEDPQRTSRESQRIPGRHGRKRHVTS